MPHERILRIQGYTDFNRVRPAIIRAATAMAALAETLSEPQVAYRHVPIISLRDGMLELQGGTRLKCEAFDRQLSGCHSIAPFVLTLGKRIPDRVVALSETGDLLEALLLETAAWLCIEDATRQFKTFLREEVMKRGSRITSRMGPGYSYKAGSGICTWSLEETPALFALFGGARLPVTLLSSCAMLPKMSRSGIYGLARADVPPLSQPTSGRSNS